MTRVATLCLWSGPEGTEKTTATWSTQQALNTGEKKVLCSADYLSRAHAKCNLLQVTSGKPDFCDLRVSAEAAAPSSCSTGKVSSQWQSPALVAGPRSGLLRKQVLALDPVHLGDPLGRQPQPPAQVCTGSTCLEGEGSRQALPLGNSSTGNKELLFNDFSIIIIL